MSDDEKKSPPDEIRFGPSIGPNSRLAVRRGAEREEETIVVHRAPEGTPIPPGAELADVDSECNDGWHKVTTIYKSGPAQVATPAYREGYDRIFGKKTKVGLA